MKKERCLYCPKEFQSPKDLKRHYEKIHNGVPMVGDRMMTLGDLIRKGKQ